MKAHPSRNPLIARKPALDFKVEDVVWEDNPEVAMIWNGSSTILPVLEPWLNRVLVRCRKQLGPEHEQLKREIDDFVRQESNHYRMHAVYNATCEKAGFAFPKEMQQACDDDYRNLLNTKSLEWLAAYCAGFENFSLYQARFTYEAAPDLLREGNSLAEMMMWHMAEEFEHRSVCHDVYAEISGNYFLRVYGLLYSFWHLNKHMNQRISMFLEKFREDMTPAQRKASIKSSRRYFRRYLVWSLPRMAKILIPFYDPSKAPAHPRLKRALERYEGMTALA